MNMQLTDHTAALKATKTAPVWVSKKTSRAWACGAEMAELRAAGASIQKLSEQYGVSWPTVRKIVAANAPYTTDRPGLDKDSHRLELQNLALQGELKVERKRSQKARDAFRDLRRKSMDRRRQNLELHTGLREELTEAKAWGHKWKAEHADIVKRLVAEQSCLIDQKQMTKSAREAYENAKKSVGELSDKLFGTKGALETATKIVEDHEAQINELRDTLELANAATNALQQKLDHAETEVTNARIAEQAAHDRLNDPSWANRWSKEAHDEFERRKQTELDLMAAEAQLERMAEKLAECRNRGFFARLFG